MENSADPDQLASSTDLDLHCLQRQGISGFSMTRINYLPYNVHVLNLKESYSTTYRCVKNVVGFVPNNADPDWMQSSLASDLGLHCLHRL